MKKIYLLLFCLPFMVYGQSGNPATLGKRDSLASKILNETRRYSVYLPQSYSEANGPALKYPVIYLLDGNDHFLSVSGLVQFLGSYAQAIPEMIIVAIPNTDRTRDLTPTHTTKMGGKDQPWLAGSGGGASFLNFIKTELIPEIESKYRTSSYRMLIGHSFGGITAINALYTMPEMFNSYISIDPSLWWDERVLLKKASSYFLTANLKGKTLFVSQANTLSPADSVNDHFESIREFAGYLDSRNRSGIKWQYKYYPDDNHGSVVLASEYDALRFIFRDYSARIDATVTPEALMKKFADFSASAGATFLPPEQTINSLGYQAMNSKKYDVAQQFFQMNIEMYPQSSNVYDSMAELLMNKGDTKKSIELYEKALKMDPKNEGAKANIKKMKEKTASKK